MRRALPLLVLVLVACAHVAPKVRPGPAIQVGFGPPPAFVQLEIARQERRSEVRYGGRDPVSVREEIRASQRESWTPINGGGWKVSAMLMDEDATRDGIPVASAVPLVGIPFVTVVDAEGRFLRVDEPGETVRQMEDRVTSESLRKMVEPLLTPELLVDRMKASWGARTGLFCHRTFTPGQSFHAIDRQELPAGGPALTIVRMTVIGEAMEGLERVMELALDYGGSTSALAREPGALQLAAELPSSEMIVESARGHGRRLVSIATCQVVAEESELEGSWSIRPDAKAGAQAGGVPERIEFKVRRGARRLVGAAAHVARPMR